MTAGRAERFAEVLLREPGPWDSMGHLLHMPSHTFQRIGRHHDGVLANVAAFEADLQDSRNCRVPYSPGARGAARVYGCRASGVGVSEASCERWDLHVSVRLSCSAGVWPCALRGITCHESLGGREACVALRGRGTQRTMPFHKAS